MVATINVCHYSKQLIREPPVKERLMQDKRPLWLVAASSSPISPTVSATLLPAPCGQIRILTTI